MLYSLSAHWLQHSAKKQKSQEAKINKSQQENTIHKSQESQSHKSHTGKQKKTINRKKVKKKHEKNIALQKKNTSFWSSHLQTPEVPRACHCSGPSWVPWAKGFVEIKGLTMILFRIQDGAPQRCKLLSWFMFINHEIIPMKSMNTIVIYIYLPQTIEFSHF